MPFVSRDPAGKINAIYQTPHDGVVEELPITHPDILAFLGTQEGAATTLVGLAQSDMEMARVIEDVISVLVLRNVISYDELPEAAQKKLRRRQEWRGNLEETLAMFGGGKVI